MDAHTVIEEWEVSPFDGGFDRLRELQSRGFSGAVEAGDSRLFLRDGEPLAVVSNFEDAPREGRIDDFEDAAGRLHEAPHPGTTSLAAMLALDGEVRGRYFSDDTPLSDVDDTLSGGGFTGYVELSENVLSGDYFAVYEGGDADYLGYISSSGRLITGEEAREKAEGEIGIYEVVAVSLPDVEIPAATEPESDPAAAGVDPTPGTDSEPEPGPDSPPSTETAPDTVETADPAPGPEADSEGDETETDAEPASTAEPEPDEPPAGSDPDAEPASASAADPDSDPDPDPDPEPTPESATEATADAKPAAKPDAGSDDSPESTAESPTPDGPSEAAAVTESGTEPTEAEPADEPSTSTTDASNAEGTVDSTAWGSADAETSSEEPQDATGSVMDGLTARAVPSVDPDNSARGQDEGGGAAARGATTGAGPDAANAARSEPSSGADTRPGAERASEAEPKPESKPEREAGTARSADVESAAESEPSADIEARLEEVREEYEAELESLRSELESLRAERDRLRDRVETLEAAAESNDAAGGDAGGVSLTPDRALAGTSLFVRDEGPGGPTLEDAHAGKADHEELADNLRIEYHTQFDDEDATVDGEAFESFLRSSPVYAFSEWLLTDLLFEIQATGSTGAMGPLYDAIPDIDRVSFGETVPVGEGGNERDIEFDVVARDRMGEPLVVANMDESREPTGAAALERLIGDASDVGMAADRFAGAFAVTSSYFDPDALAAAREATSGSLLSREKYRNFVKLSRKNGFHLGLVESRDESFHMTMPEL